MSKYTTELQNIILAEVDLGLDTYPIFLDEYRPLLNQKIFNHYYFHEIGFETVQRFKHYLNATMCEIMPYYNQLLKSELLTFNPLLSFERTSNVQKDINSTSLEDLSNTVVKTVASIDDSNSVNGSTSTTDQTLVKEVIDVDDKTDTHTINTTSDDTIQKDITDSRYKTIGKTGSITLDQTNAKDTTDSSDQTVDVTASIHDDVTGHVDTTQTSTIVLSKTNTANNSVNDKDIFSDTPKSMLSSPDISANVYASTANIKTNLTVVDEAETGNNTDTVVKGEDSTTATVNTSTNGSVGHNEGVSNSDETIHSVTTSTDTETDHDEGVVGHTETDHVVSLVTDGDILHNDSSSSTDETLHNVAVVSATGSDHATGSVNENSSNTGANNTTNTSNEVQIVTENGFEIPLSDLLLKYRSTFLNIDTMIIGDLKDLFMQIY